MSSAISPKRKSQQRQALFRIIVLAIILVLVNMLASRFHYGLDLTKEKRFTLSDATKKMLRNLDDVAVVEVYLKAKDLPADFQRLSEATRERLQQFKEYAGNRLIFKFYDPLEGKEGNDKLAVEKQLYEKGIMQLQIQDRKDDNLTVKVVIPFALVTYKGKTTAVSLIESPKNPAKGLQPEDLNYAETLLEYKFATAIHKADLPDKPRIAYLWGNGETFGPQSYDALTELGRNYHLDTFDLLESPYIPAIYNTIIINKPTIPFSEKEKFKIDQYVMNGGNVLWLIDMLHTPMDSLATAPQFMTEAYELNLDDLFFKFGVRLNNDLIEDWQCLPIPVAKENSLGDKAQYDLRRWIYFPVFTPTSSHPIVKNMLPVMGRFSNTIDTIKNDEIRKTVLLQSSKNSRTTPNPARISLSILKHDMRPDMFNKGDNNVAVLVEGTFQSLYKNRMDPGFLSTLRDSLKRPYSDASKKESKMIFIADADIIENDFSQTRGMMEMGYWRYTGEFYANKSFILNCVEYLTDSTTLLEARSKEARLRLLDPERTKKEKEKWQAINIVVPIAAVLLFASCYMFFRKRKYEK